MIGQVAEGLANNMFDNPNNEIVFSAEDVIEIEDDLIVAEDRRRPRRQIVESQNSMEIVNSPIPRNGRNHARGSEEDQHHLN